MTRGGGKQVDTRHRAGMLENFGDTVMPCSTQHRAGSNPAPATKWQYAAAYAVIAILIGSAFM